MSEIVNLTPHDIHVFEGDRVITFSRSDKVARVGVIEIPCEPINDIPTLSIAYHEVLDLPEEKPNTFYIVSLLVGKHVKTSRNDLIGPNTNSAIRDNSGNIRGVPGFVRY